MNFDQFVPRFQINDRLLSSNCTTGRLLEASQNLLLLLVVVVLGDETLIEKALEILELVLDGVSFDDRVPQGQDDRDAEASLLSPFKGSGVRLYVHVCVWPE